MNVRNELIRTLFNQTIFQFKISLDTEYQFKIKLDSENLTDNELIKDIFLGVRQFLV